jgi:hypothetical protein
MVSRARLASVILLNVSVYWNIASCNVAVYWNIASCSQYVKGRSGGTYLLLQGPKSAEQQTKVLARVGRMPSSDWWDEC